MTCPIWRHVRLPVRPVGLLPPLSRAAPWGVIADERPVQSRKSWVGTRTTGEVEIAAPIHAVFAFVTNPVDDPLWKDPKRHAKGAFTCVLTSSGPIGLGT